jgi:hypothetical protein
LILVISTRQTRPITTKLATAHVELTHSSAQYVPGNNSLLKLGRQRKCSVDVAYVPTDLSNDNRTQAMMMRMVLIKTLQKLVN